MIPISKYLPGADGEKVSAWPRDEEGNVVATPLISVSSSGYWQVSYDNGQTYTSLGSKAEGGSQEEPVYSVGRI